MSPIAATEIPSLGVLLAYMTPGGVTIGAVIGLFVRAETNRRMIENVVLGGDLGAIVGAIVAFVIGLVDAIAGG